jgi:hypothetical protein
MTTREPGQGLLPPAVASGTPLRVLPLGDSITWGEGGSTGDGYRGPLWDRLTAAAVPGPAVGSGRRARS